MSGGRTKLAPMQDEGKEEGKEGRGRAGQSGAERAGREGRAERAGEGKEEGEKGRAKRFARSQAKRGGPRKEQKSGTVAPGSRSASFGPAGDAARARHRP